MANYGNAVPTSLGYFPFKLLCVGSAAVVGAKFYLTSCGKLFQFDCVKFDESSLADPNYPQGIIVFDENANSISEYHRRLSGMYKNVPIVLCGNEPGAMDLPYFEISAKNNHSLEEPFLYLAKELTGNNELCFVNSLVPACADVQIPELPKNNELLFVNPQKPKSCWGKVMKLVWKAIACGAHVNEVCDAVSDIF